MTLDPELAERVGYVFVARFIAFLGIIGNIVSYLILRRRRLNDSPYTYLSAITVADLIVLVIFLGLGFVRCGTCKQTDDEAYKSKYYECYIYLPFVNMASNASLFIALAMTMERFIFVRFPLLAKKVCDQKKARLITASIVFLAITINIPRFFLFDICRPPDCDVTKIPDMIKYPGILPRFLTVECAFAPKLTPTPELSFPASETRMSRCVLLTRHNTTMEVDGVTVIARPLLPGNITNLNATMLPRSEGKPRRSLFDFKIRKCNIAGTIKNNKTSSAYNGSLITSIDLEDDSEDYVFFNWTVFVNPRPMIYATSYFNRNNSDKDELASMPYSSYHAATETVEFYWKRNDSKAISRSIQNLLGRFNYHVIINITSKDIITSLLKQLPCLESKFNDTEVPDGGNNSTKPTPTGKTLIPAVPYDPKFIKFTNFYFNYHEFFYHGVLALEVVASIAVIILNVLLVHVLRKSFKKRQALILASASYCSPRASMSVAAYTKHVHDQQRLTITLVVITCLVAITTVFGFMTSDLIATLIYTKNYRWTTGFRIYGMIANLLITTNHSINFALYALFNKRFQLELQSFFNDTLGKCCSCTKIPCTKANLSTNEHRRLNSVRTISTSSSWTEEMTSITSCQEVNLQSVTSIRDLSL